jgi:hypothetical protein
VLKITIHVANLEKNVSEAFAEISAAQSAFWILVQITTHFLVRDQLDLFEIVWG